MSFGEIPRGVNDAKAYPLTGDTPGSAVDVPGIRSVTYNVESDSDELKGDDATIALVRNPAKLTGSLEVGRTNPAALAVMLGGSAATSGTTPNQIVTLNQSDAAVTAYFQLVAQANSQDANGSAYRATLKKLLATSGPSETLSVDEWSTPSIDFEGIGISGVLLSRALYETAVALT